MDVRFSETIFEEESAHNPVGQGNTSVQSASALHTQLHAVRSADHLLFCRHHSAYTNHYALIPL